MVLIKRQSSCSQQDILPTFRRSTSHLPIAHATDSSWHNLASTWKGSRSNSSSPLQFWRGPRWWLSITYGLAILSCLGGLRSNRQLNAMSTSLDDELRRLTDQRDETLSILQQAQANKDDIERKHKRLERTQRLFQHEMRMKEELYEMESEPSFDETVKLLHKQQRGNAMNWIQQRQEALHHKIYSLQDHVKATSRQQVLDKYGPGPHRVEFQVKTDSKQRRPSKFMVELAPVDLVPHAIETFLDMISNQIWDNTVFYHHSTQHHVVAAAPINYGTFETKQYHLDALGYTGVSFPEYSEEFPHDEYTLGFSGRGPNFYINTRDNSKHHGPGGQGHHEMPNDADPCFGKIVWGKKVVQDMMPATSRVALPVSWEDFDVTQIVSIRLVR